MKKLSVVVFVILGLSILCNAAPPRPPKADKAKEDVKKDTGTIEVGSDKAIHADVQSAQHQQKVDHHEPEQMNEEDYDETFQFLRDQPELAKKIRGINDDALGNDLADPAFHDLNEKMLDRFDDEEYEQVRHQRDLEHQMQEARERQEHPDSFRLHHDSDETFDMKELNEKIQEASKRLRDTDDERHREFLRYELEKELKEKKEIEKMSPEEKKTAQEKLSQRDKEKKDHPKLHHPGSKEQLEEVWEKEDGFEHQEFNPSAFFKLHDTNGDGFLDNIELEAVFRKEVSKLVGTHKGAYDERELKEEVARMRQHVANEIDGDKDGLVSLDEFLKSTKKPEFNKDEGWETFDEDKNFGKMSPEELERYERRVREAARKGFDKQPLRDGTAADPHKKA